MNTQEDNQVSGMSAAPAQSISVGKTLREARELQGMSVNDVANRIKFAPRQIESLEADDFVRLPEAAFVRGFVRSYARLLDLDSASLLASLPTSHMQKSTAHEIKSVEIPMPSALSARRHNIIWLAAALVVALSLAIFERLHDRAAEGIKPVVKNSVEPLELPNIAAEGASAPLPDAAADAANIEQEVVRKDAEQATRQPQVQQVLHIVPEPKPRQVAPQPVVRAAPEAVQRQPEVQKVVRTPSVTISPQQPVPQQAAPATLTHARTPAPAANEQPKVSNEVTAAEHALRIELDEDAWVEVRDGSDKVLISKMHRAGSLIRVAGKGPMLVTLGNARAVRLFDNGKNIKLERYTTAEVAKVKLK
jgi:cytoskeleton protein RodZ